MKSILKRKASDASQRQHCPRSELAPVGHLTEPQRQEPVFESTWVLEGTMQGNEHQPQIAAAGLAVRCD